MNGLSIALILAINNLLCFGLINLIYIKQLSIYWLSIPVILYGLQVLLFYWGLVNTSMAVLNIYWNLIFNLIFAIMSLLGLFYFAHESINSLKMSGLIVAVISIVLFTWGSLV